MPFVAFGLAQLLGVSPALTAGFVILGSLTPELVTPVMTQLSGGDTALSATALVLIGLGTVGHIPVVVTLLLAGTVTVDQWAIVTELVFAVVLPMLVAIGVRRRWPTRISQYEEYYPSVLALMVILIIGIVTAANAAMIRSAGPTLAWSAWVRSRSTGTGTLLDGSPDGGSHETNGLQLPSRWGCVTLRLRRHSSWLPVSRLLQPSRRSCSESLR